MSRLETSSTVKELKNSGTKKVIQKTKILVILICSILIGLIAISHINGNVFMEHLATCAFIISCIALIKLMEIQQN